MIEITNLKKSFGGKTAIDIPALSVADGSIVGIVGNNGAGKTTLFRLMLDLLKADSGAVLSQGANVAQSEDWKSFTGSFLDSRFLIEFLTPEEFLHFVGKTYGLPESDTDERLQTFSRFMNGEILGQKKYIRNFSAGNKQKIGIIAAMMIRPQVLILDEPFNFLDPSSQMEIRDMIRRLNEELHTTVLLSSHNLAYTTDVSTRLILLEHGLVIKDLPNSPAAVDELTGYFLRQTEG
jgi:ABC-2 type transport system ATP-binding protein